MMRIPPMTTLIAAKFASRCACGASVSIGDSIAYGRAYNHAVVGCAACNFGLFDGISIEGLVAEVRGNMGLADNAMRIAALSHPKARAKANAQVARLLTRCDLAAAALDRARASEHAA